MGWFARRILLHELLDGTIVEVEDEVLEAYGIDGIERLVNN
jgi:hypothetical protein